VAADSADEFTQLEYATEDSIQMMVGQKKYG